ncbi:MAG: helix-turn-helix domain-containing protein [Bacteroidales bacterium]|nr:helix-turn-helix domain-containing protein [Candidatus Equimonas enterica]
MEKKKSRREQTLERMFVELRKDVIAYIDEQFNEATKSQMAEFIEKKVSKAADEKMKLLMPQAIATIEAKISHVLNLPLSVKQVALLTGRTEASIYKMCQRKQIPFVKNGGVVHIYLRDVNDMLLFLQN